MTLQDAIADHFPDTPMRDVDLFRRWRVSIRVGEKKPAVEVAKIIHRSLSKRGLEPLAWDITKDRHGYLVGMSA